MSQSTDDQSISATSAAGTGSTTTNAAYSQQTVQMQNNTDMNRNDAQIEQAYAEGFRQMQTLFATGQEKTSAMFYANQEKATAAFYAAQAQQAAAFYGTITVIP